MSARGWVGLLPVLMACGTEPELQQARKALKAWDDAEQATESKPRQAALEQALAADPGSLALRRSMARELGEAGAYAEAVAMLDAVLPPEPTPPYRLAVWDRAALHAGAGAFAAAAHDIQTCLQLGVDPRALAADPSFAVLMAHADYAHLLPKPALVVREAPPPSKVLVGESWRRTVRVGSPGPGVALVPVSPIPAELLLTEVTEDVLNIDHYHAERELRLEWTARGAGDLHVPGIQVQSADQSTALAPADVEVVQLGAPSTVSGDTVAPLLVPSTFDEAGPTTESPVAAAGGWVVQAPAHWSCTLSPTPAGAVRLIRREGGQPRWTGWWVPEGSGAQWACAGEGISLTLR